METGKCDMAAVQIGYVKWRLGVCLKWSRYSEQQLLSEKVSGVSESAKFAKLWPLGILQYTHYLLYYLDVLKGQVYSMDFTDSVKELYKFSSCAGNCIYVWISVI